MARRKKRSRGRRRSRGNGRVVIKAHTRDPRGPNRGKKRVRVRRHRRTGPNKG